MLISKVLATPLLILAATLVARRWGPAMGGIVAALPFVSGPGSLFMALQQGLPFAAIAAKGALLGVVSACAYCVGYAYSARIWQWKACLAIGISLFFITAACSFYWGRSLVITSFLTICTPLICIVLLPKVKEATTKPSPPKWLLPVQMLCGGLMVALLTEAAGTLGGHWSGVLLMFPVVSSIILPFYHRFYGGAAVVAMIKGLFSGFIASSGFAVIIAVFLEKLGILYGYSFALVFSLVSALFVIIFSRSTQKAKRKKM